VRPRTDAAEYRRGLEEAVASAAVEAGVRPGAVVLVAVSAGPDSTALLRALAARRGALGVTLAAAIVEHGIRPPEETTGDIDLVERACGALGIPLTVSRVPAGQCRARARELGRSLEEVARDARHRLLRDVARAAGAPFIALGHTQDDQVETLLMRVLAGAGPEGLRGMPLRRGPFIRPLLRCTRADVIDYLRSLSQPWREDPTNADTTITRNRVRHLLVPRLEESFPGYRAGLSTLARRMVPVSELVRVQARDLPWRVEGGGHHIPRQDFFAAPAAVRAASLLTLYDSFRGPSSPRRLPWRFLAPALGTDPGRDGWLLRGYGAGFRVHGDAVSWGPCLASRCKIGYFMEAYEAGNTAIRETGVSVRLTRVRGAACEERGALSLLVEDVAAPLVLRSKRKGDEILLEGGATPLKELLAGWKIPPADRERIPVLADRKGVVAVLGGALGYRNRVRAGAVGRATEVVDRIEVHIIHEQGRGT
jgi:tRNA(Ile)-lysidine synthase